MNVNLVLFKKNGSQKNFPLPSSVTVIGRRHDCDLCIPLTSVSRRHCQLNHSKGILKIRDLGSRNGTYLNGERIKEAVIKAGDSIEVGPLTFVIQIDGQPKDVTQPDLTAQNLPQQDTSTTEDMADEQFDSFAELNDSDASEDDADSLLDDFDTLEDDV